MAEWYEILIPIAALITASVALITIFFLKKQLKMTEKAFDSAKDVAEIGAFQKLEQNFSYDKSLQKVRAIISSQGPVLKEDGGTINYSDFATYLHAVNELLFYSRMKIIKEINIVNAFGAAAIEIEDNPYVMKFIKNQQDKDGKGVLAGINMLAERTRKLRPGLVSKD